jgi:hypothetical protein
LSFPRRFRKARLAAVALRSRSSACARLGSLFVAYGQVSAEL